VIHSSRLRHAITLRQLSGFLAAGLVITAMSIAGLSPAQAEGVFERVATINVTFSSEIVVRGNRAYVASGAEISIIDTTTNTVISTVPLTGVSGLSGAATIGDKVYFAARTTGRLIILDTQTNTVTYLTTTGCTNPTQLLAFSATRLVANCHGTANVMVIDVAGPTIAGLVATGTQPRGMSANGDFVFVPNSGAVPGTVTVVNAAASPPTAVQTINVGNQPEYTAFLDGKIYAANFAANTVTIIDGSSYAVIATLSVGNNPQGIAPCGNNVYTSNRWTGNTSVISPTSNTVINTIPLSDVGAITHVMGVNGDYAYFMNFDRSSLSVVDCTTQTVAATVSIAPNPSWIAFSPDYAYVTGVNTISVVSIPRSGSAIPQDITQRPPDWMKQVGRVADEACETDWNPSWAEWPNGGTGGFVCTQVWTWSHRQQSYVLQGE
jgi:YVTN family beta-propeller protein